MTSKKKILVVQKIHEVGMQLLNNNPNYEYEIIDAEEMVTKVDPEVFKKKIEDCDGLSIRTEKLTGDIINHGKKLKVISRHGVGYDNIDLAATKKNNITLTITSTANAIAVAEHVMFMLLSISKGTNMYNKAVKSGNFSDRNKLPKTIELWKKNILIVGFGRIGQCLIKRCLGFEMNVFVYDPFITSEKIKSLGGQKVEKLEEAIKIMDAISLHLPLNDKTKNLIDMSLLKTMKRNCILINAARGGIINEIDLNTALNDGLIYGAGLDVFSKEPPDANNPLLKNDKVFLSPHTAPFTEECMQRMGKETIQNIIDFFENKLDKSKIVKL
ncbi:MAG: hydroxyacid dehydrogenase [Alphaproteobacteria bacterium]|jgi:D-3-phosphoglycerate dehydrogenase|nr:hydroxyacid dehydrogenase [Alphaproteobacteria bacterium]